MGSPAPAGVAASGLPPAGDQATNVVSGIIAAIGPSKCFAFYGQMNLFLWASYVDNTGLVTTANSSTATVGTGTGLAIGGAINSVNVPKGTTWLTYSGTSGTLAFSTLTWPARVVAGSAQMINLPSTAGLVGSAVSGPGVPAGTTVLSVVTPAVAGANSGVVLLSAAATLTTPFSPIMQWFDFALTNSSVIAGTDAAASFTGIGITFNGTIQIERSFDGGSTWILCNIGGAGAPASFAGTAQTPVSIAFGEPEKMMLYRMNCTAFTGATGKTLNYRISQTGLAAMSLSLGTPI